MYTSVIPKLPPPSPMGPIYPNYYPLPSREADDCWNDWRPPFPLEWERRKDYPPPDIYAVPALFPSMPVHETYIS